jgi:Uma2 family endonuclease
MATVPVAQRMTAEEFLARPVHEGSRFEELIEGELVMNEPLSLHERHVFKLLRALDAWATSEAGRGEVRLPMDVDIDERNVYKPDLHWYREGRSPSLHDWHPYPMPDIAVEVRSPSTWRYDIGAKKAGYERFGLPELWLVDTAADELLLFRRSAPRAPTFDVALELTHDDTLTSPLLPGFALALAELFPPA